MKRYLFLVVLVACVAGCVDGDPVAPGVCVPADSMTVGPYVASICVELS